MWAIPSALTVGAFIGIVVFTIIVSSTKDFRRATTAGIIGFVVMFIWEWWAQYLTLVPYTGYLGGYGYRVSGAATALGAAGAYAWAGAESDRGRYGGSRLLAGALSLATLCLAGWVGIYFSEGVGRNNNIRWSDLANVTVAPSSERPDLPDTDPNEYISMDCHLAWTKAHSALGTGGDNLGSYFDVHEDECVQQWVKDKNYFVFPLELNGWMQQEGWLTRQISESPGYVAVRADDPHADVKIVSNLKLKYMPQSFFSLNLERYIYTSGYRNGRLVSPSLEVDDNWKPFFTVAYVQPAFVIGGDVVVKVLVIDPATGTIDEYDPDKIPDWVDRVNDSSMVSNWVESFALYHFNPDFWNSNKAGQMQMDHMRLVNVHGQHQVWQIPLLANNSDAISTNGLVLYDTRRQRGTFYEAAHFASGLMSYEKVRTAFAEKDATTRGWRVDHIQWYVIKGVPTWMAIYSNNNIFAGVGFLDATSSNIADVRYGQSRDQALEQYYQYLSTRGARGGEVSEQVVKQTITAVIYRIGQETLSDNQVVYTIIFKGEPRVFSVARGVSELLPGVREGDTVTLTFDEPAKPMSVKRSVTGFADKTLERAMEAQAPTK